MRPRGRPVKDPSHNGRKQLLEAAMTLFAEQGISATSVADIAAHAGVTPAMVHYYFKNREQLLDAVVEERLQEFISFVWDPVSEGGDDPLAMLTGLVHRIMKVTDQMPCIPSLWVQEVLSEGGLLRERVLKRLPVNKLKHISNSISIAQSRGSINPEIDPALVVLSVVGLTMIPLAAPKIWHRLPNVERLNKEILSRHVVALLAYGLSNPQRKHRGKTTQKSGGRDAKNLL